MCNVANKRMPRGIYAYVYMCVQWVGVLLCEVKHANERTYAFMFSGRGWMSGGSSTW